MAGPCRIASSPVIRWRPEQVGPGQLDLFRRVIAAAPGGATSGPAIPGLELVEELLLDECRVRLLFIRRVTARHFRLTVPSRHQARCTVPPGASLEDARRFVQHARDWLARQVASHPGPEPDHTPLVPGGEYWLHGQPERLRPDPISGGMVLGGWTLSDLPASGDLRPALEDALRLRADLALRSRTAELAARLGLEPPPVRIRPQRARWGSCSPRGTVSLNWRLIQIPPEVRDYVILHELVHLRHPGHTTRFWAEVRQVFPDWAGAEAWLRGHSHRFLPAPGGNPEPPPDPKLTPPPAPADPALRVVAPRNPPTPPPSPPTGQAHA